jgi:rhodanese-related sulfurtransferase
MSVLVAGTVDRVASRLPALSPSEARHAWDAGATVIDLRTAGERRRDGDLPGALRLAPDQLADLDLSDETTVILVCAEGDRSDRLAGILHRRGFGNVTWVGGGYRAWLDAVWRQWSEMLVCDPGTPASRFTRLITHRASAPVLTR